MNIKTLLLHKICQAAIAIKLDTLVHLIKIQQSTKPKFGDYQINGLIVIAKRINLPVVELSKKLVQHFKCKEIAKIIKIESQGFINIFLRPQWVANQADRICFSWRLGCIQKEKKTIIIDYSGPNIAKEMHVGHLRSTIIGDSITRILSFLGNHVIRSNHIGDWGTQFGMLIAYIEKTNQIDTLLQKTITLSTLESFYKQAKKKYDIDPDFAELSRNYVLQLQQGNKHYLQIWKKLVHISISNNQKLYVRLNVTLDKSDVMGESFYNHMLPDIVSDLKNKKLAVISNGATVVFLDNTYDKNGMPFGVVIQKKDGAYLYSTTDIACIKYRCEILQADRIIYYIDSRQQQHLIQAWKIADKAGYIKKSTSLEHHICGMLLDNNKKPFKTRSGNALKLTTLLDEAFIRSYNLIKQKNPTLALTNNTKINTIAHAISIGAIKYSELSKNRTTNYIFNWDSMLAFEGNTAPYIQYAYTRILSIFKHFKQYNSKIRKNNIQIKNKEELLLAICLLQFEETIITVANQGKPHLLCSYLHKLSILFSVFYENCPIRQLNNSSLKYSRLKLILLTGRILKKGLSLLGIKTVKQM